ncbi:Na/Pi cotransporter family protein [Marinilactibacillus psychrotolerans]|uniref:Na/Pi cotransporter family protein n=2 Tax=Marinilactibacillus psychrotolerans TaxID=191770 RepID=A0A5R9C6W6_9LACT|nr:Na/Pi cotransporter family protein [Marinilactibacillus psychrotolerans]TLQ08866.1 Na/Pi cotransporter family protein [Marinilactibacillus psychrotolerans]SJN36004.1 Sodium-dependent phosphate transporter [Marinilactibacillus psychrotolerans 42ea]
MDVQQIIFQFIGGLGIFLFGLKYMGDGLQRSAGDNLRDILNKFTSTPFRAVLAGIVVTVLIQSSSGTTVLTVGLVSAGFMKLKQAIGIVMGANIGTTVTAFIIGFDIGAYALPIIAVGALLLFFFKRPFINSLGQVIFGFGALFYGLELMGDGLRPLEDLEVFTNAMVTLSHNPILGVVSGTLFTFMLQSSSATIGILQELYSQGSMSLEAALPILFGSNIGTTITAILAAIGASVAAKRTSASHIIFNLSGTIIILLLLSPFTSLVSFLSTQLNLNAAMQIAFAHGMFNVFNVLVQMWFISQIAALVTRLVPGDDALIEYDSSNLDYSIIQTAPSIALNQAKLEIAQMGEFVTEEFKSMFNYYKNQDEKSRLNTMQLEEVVNKIDVHLTEYLMLISVEDLPLQNSTEHAQLVDVTKYLERIGDHSENVIKNIQEAVKANKKHNKNNSNKKDEKVFYDDDLVKLFELVEQNIKDAVESFSRDSYALAGKVLKREKDVNKLEDDIRSKFIERLNKGVGLPSDGILFVDIVSNLERMSDHSTKIAKHTLGMRYPFQKQSKIPRHGYIKEVAEPIELP